MTVTKARGHVPRTAGPSSGFVPRAAAGGLGSAPVLQTKLSALDTLDVP